MLSKLVNSLSWGLDVINPIPIDSQATIFYIDLRHYEWDVNDGWTKIEGEYSYHITFDAPAQSALREQLTWLQTQMKCDVPSIHIDWFIARASTPPLYHELLSLPLWVTVEYRTRLVQQPGIPQRGPKIEGPWLWVVLPERRLSSDTDLLSEASRGAVTEAEIATHGATAGNTVGDAVWISHRLPSTGEHNVEQMLGGRIDGASIYGTATFRACLKKKKVV